MSNNQIPLEDLAAQTIAMLGADAVQKANSGHPGMVMGMADIATVLWGQFVNYDPNDAGWQNRDRVVLSNGHGSMLLYSALYLTGQAFTLDDLKEFRQWGSITAGHPEYGYAPGIETTTGPLGQGVANAVGFAMAERWQRERFGAELVDHYTYALCGDGCLMEGIASEAASLAGHLNLGKLILIYDDNSITIDGETDITFSEDVAARFLAYGWTVYTIDGHDRDAIARAISWAQGDATKPTLIRARTKIGKHAPTKEGSNSSHGSPLGEDELAQTKRNIGWDPDMSFVVPEDAVLYFRQRHFELSALRNAWDNRLDASANGPAYRSFFAQESAVSKIDWPSFETGSKIATRASSGQVIQSIAAALPGFVGGSADLAGSNKTTIKGEGHWSADSFAGRNIHFGVREHAMAAIANGLSLYGGFRPFCATFLVFHDYMRPAVRLASLMHQPTLFVYTHDSIFVGEDGPTHQPIEHLESIRLIPGVRVLRPCDANESVTAWQLALSTTDAPSVLCFTRQSLPILEETANSTNREMAAQTGASILFDATEPELVICATGSEVHLALDAAKLLSERGKRARVVSMLCREQFQRCSTDAQESLMPAELPTIYVEAGVRGSWGGWRLPSNVRVVSIDRFGASAPGAVVAKNLGLTVDAIVKSAVELLGA